MENFKWLFTVAAVNLKHVSNQIKFNLKCYNCNYTLLYNLLSHSLFMYLIGFIIYLTTSTSFSLILKNIFILGSLSFSCLLVQSLRLYLCFLCSLFNPACKVSFLVVIFLAVCILVSCLFVCYHFVSYCFRLLTQCICVTVFSVKLHFFVWAPNWVFFLLFT